MLIVSIAIKLAPYFVMAIHKGKERGPSSSAGNHIFDRSDRRRCRFSTNFVKN